MKIAMADRRQDQRERLIACAERIIAVDGLGALRARDLARDLGCAVGALYNLVTDLDELVLLVARRTQNDLVASLCTVAASHEGDEAVVVAWADAYLRFARENRLRWRALFEFRLPPGKALPEWFAREQESVFLPLEERLASLAPEASLDERRLRARILFAAVHGIVTLSLEEKIETMPLEAVRVALPRFVRSALR